MKKILLALLATASIHAAHAQKNSILTFGNLNYNMQNNDLGGGATTKSNMFGINPGVGYRISNKSTIGIQGGYNFMNSVTSINILTVNIDLEDRQTEWQAGAFYRYTHNFNNTFFIFGQVNAGYLSGETSQDTIGLTTVGKITESYSGVAVNAFPALGINVHKGWALNFSFGGIAFNTLSWDKANLTTTNLGVNFGQQMNFGITKNFSCHCHKHKGHHQPGDDMRKTKMEKDDDDE